MNQSNQILRHLEAGHTLTALEAWRRFGCLRLAARVRDLKDRGYDVRSRLVVRRGKRFAEYWL